MIGASPGPDKIIEQLGAGGVGAHQADAQGDLMNRRDTQSLSSRVIGAVAILALLSPACSASEPETPVAVPTGVAYVGARLIVGDGRVIDGATFVVDGGEFVAIGESGEIDVVVAEIVDLSGMTVMPAIVDAHTHLSTTREALIDDLERRAYYGVGAALSLGHDAAGAPLEVRDEVIAGAARYRSAGRGITMPEPGRTDASHWITTEEEARQAVRDEAARSVDIIKIWVDDRNGRYDKLGPELYGPIIDEAHQNDIRVTAHIFTLDDAKGLLRAGVDAFAHGVRDRDVDDEFVALVRERPNVVLVPNLPGRGVPIDLAWLAGSMPAAELARLQENNVERPTAQEGFALQARNLARLSEAGMPIALGTDGNTPWAPHVEMEDMVAAGMSPAEVIVAATSGAAALVGIDDVGTVQAGKSADFIVLEADPLQDITNTRRIVSVYLRGDALDRDAMSARYSAEAGR